MGTFKALFLTQLTMANMEKGTEYTNLSVLIFGLGANFRHFYTNLWGFKLMLRYEVSLA